MGFVEELTGIIAVCESLFSFCLASVASLMTPCAAAGPSAGTLSARPGAVSGKPAGAGTHPLGLRVKRDALLYVPKISSKNLVVYLHGAGGSEEQGPKRLGALSEKLGFLLLSPASADRTWDAIRDGFGADVQIIDASLRKVYAERNVERTVVAGFSDGASYALGLGIRNAGLLSAVAAFSPGFIAGGTPPKTKSRIFVSHGIDDEILPIHSCSRQLVPRLKRDGHEVSYREFQGPHTVPAEIAEEGLRWVLGL
mgnify:CR=1 FL=1